MSLRRKLMACLRDERGTEVVEYALLLGLLIVGCIAVLGALGIKLQGRWQRIFDLLS